MFTQIKIHLQSEMSVNVGIFLRLLENLSCHSWGFSH